ncbi:hypothetical protein IE988_19525 [Klebsiella pneumoniae]|uniref:Uncharacterized protein n=1 Tax=Klebsiella pneumoniae TaxID=573 RepID=A0A927HU67_KLEPN|nr:hypothetical protein [Klebsiella pneumoniae]
MSKEHLASRYPAPAAPFARFILVFISRTRPGRAALIPFLKRYRQALSLPAFFLAYGRGCAPRWHGLSVTLSLYARLQRITNKVVCRYCINRYFRYIFAIACGDRMISK